MKDIVYRGGLISFKIFSNWIEEYEELGGATFYEDKPDSGTLRLNVLTINKNGNDDPSDILRNQENTVYFKEYLSMENDEVLESLKRTEEDGTEISIYSFISIHLTGQNDFLIAIFTWTIKSEFENQANFIKELISIRNSIRGAKFGR